jgi:formylglycine-generating enzyme required for sulfatase activity
MATTRISAALGLAWLLSVGTAGAQGSGLVEMVFVEGGSFVMGSAEGNASEAPSHEARLGGFLIGKFEVTQAQWMAVMGSAATADRGKGDRFPVYNVSWQDAAAFCNKLSLMEGLVPCYSGSGAGTVCDFSASGYRLPTEAEWEYAARGGKEGGGRLYSGSDDAQEAGWDSANSGSATHETGTKIPNELGLYDMSGNVWEWCGDWYSADYYGVSPALDPKGPETGIYRVQRGGSYGINAFGLRCSNRYYGAHRSDSSTGFRIARSGQ